jgi:hypothetical protein
MCLPYSVVFGIATEQTAEGTQSAAFAVLFQIVLHQTKKQSLTVVVCSSWGCYCTRMQGLISTQQPALVSLSPPKFNNSHLVSIVTCLATEDAVQIVNRFC